MFEPDLFLLSLGFSLILLGSLKKHLFIKCLMENIYLLTEFFYLFRWNTANCRLSFTLSVSRFPTLELIALDRRVFARIGRGLGRTRAARRT